MGVMRPICVVLLSVMGWMAGQGPTDTNAAEFRIETEIFLDDAKEAAVETLTIFSDGVVYDFVRTGTEEITVFDQDRDRFVMLDTKRRVKTVLTLDDLLNYVAQMKTSLSDEDRSFLLGDEIKIEVGEDGWLTLSNGSVTYHVEGVEPKAKEAVNHYRQFADWYARLNALRPGNSPPFARLQVNSELAARGLIPKTIERTITHRRGLQEKKQVVRSQHLANWRLSQTDRQSIDRAGRCLADFTDVPLREYLQLPEEDADERVTSR
jgi:hypothetical protein